MRRPRIHSPRKSVASSPSTGKEVIATPSTTSAPSIITPTMGTGSAWSLRKGASSTPSTCGRPAPGSPTTRTGSERREEDLEGHCDQSAESRTWKLIPTRQSAPTSQLMARQGCMWSV